MTSKLTIISNHHRRELLYWEDLSNEERAEFDWIDASETGNFEFFRYKGWTYCTADFMRVNGNDALVGWDGYSSVTVFSGVLIRYPVEDGYFVDGEIIIGWYLS